MIQAGEFRNGITVEIEGNVFQIVEFQHVSLFFYFAFGSLDFTIDQLLLTRFYPIIHQTFQLI